MASFKELRFTSVLRVQIYNKNLFSQALF
jgi:hypothetical protein